MRIPHAALLFSSHIFFGATDFGISDSVQDSVSLRRPTNGNLPQKDALITSLERHVAKKCQHREVYSKELTESFAEIAIELSYCKKYEFSQKFTNSRVVDDVVDNYADLIRHARSLHVAHAKFRSWSNVCYLLSEVWSKLQGSTDILTACQTCKLCVEIPGDPFSGTHKAVTYKAPSLPTEDTSIPMSSPSSSLSSSPLSLSTLISPSSSSSSSSATSTSPDPPLPPPVKSPSIPSVETPMITSLAPFQSPTLSSINLGVLSDEADISKKYLQVTQLISGVTVAEAGQPLFLSIFTIEITAILNIDVNQIGAMTVAAAAVIDQYTPTKSTDSKTKTLLSTSCGTEKKSFNGGEELIAPTSTATIPESSGSRGIVPANFTVGVAVAYALKNTNYSSVEAQVKLSVAARRLTAVIVAAGYVKAVVSKIVIVVVMIDEMSERESKTLSSSAIASIIIASITVIWIVLCYCSMRKKVQRIVDENPATGV